MDSEISRKFSCALLGLTVLVLASEATAISGAGAIILALNPSARAAGMGQTGTAVFWGDSPNHWANPALLGHHRGLGYQRSEFPLAVGLADDISFEAERWTLGVAGFGLLVAGKPSSSWGGYELDMGEQSITDENGEVIGTFESWMKVQAWGVGFSLAEFADTIAKSEGRAEPGLSRYVDFAAGFTYKNFQDQVVPDEVLQDPSISGSAQANTYDYGFFLRISPLNMIGRVPEPASFAEVLDQLCGGLRLDLSAGLAVLNTKEEYLVRGDSDQADPLPKMHRHGWAARLATGFPAVTSDYWREYGLGWLVDSLTPLVSFGWSVDEMHPGIVWDSEQQRYVYERDEKVAEKYRGWELSIANIYHVRRGHTRVPAGDIDGDTEGWGWGFHLGDVFGFRYDKATVPQASGLPPVTRESWTVFLDFSAF